MFLFVKGTFLKPLQRKVDEHLRMEKAECLGKGKAGKEFKKVDKELLNRQEETGARRQQFILLSIVDKLKANPDREQEEVVNMN